MTPYSAALIAAILCAVAGYVIRKRRKARARAEQDWKHAVYNPREFRRDRRRG
ncbi:hypothetical protein KTE91_28885 [Burkholderia multivorans]|uniref:hypothetical protein n=1 Tax=Burkholderia multivorans TaxID=87883 RepID=UPI001C21CA8F|nr:hypothetical protein [Burkholderia multivorans]